jgi:hypothetical protein
VVPRECDYRRSSCLSSRLHAEAGCNLMVAARAEPPNNAFSGRLQASRALLGSMRSLLRTGARKGRATRPAAEREPDLIKHGTELQVPEVQNVTARPAGRHQMPWVRSDVGSGRRVARMHQRVSHRARPRRHAHRVSRASIGRRAVSVWDLQAEPGPRHSPRRRCVSVSGL